MSPGLVQTGRLPCRSTLRPRWALRLTSVASPRCLESTSTTDVRTTSTRREHHFWRLPAGERGKPAALRLRDRLRKGVLPPPPRALPDHLAVIRPPTAARLTARSRLRVDRAPLLLALSRQRGRAPKPYRLAGAPSIEPSDTSCGRPERGPRSRRDSSRLSTALPGHVNETGFCEARGAFHRRGPRRTLSRELAGERCRPLAGGGSRRTCSSRLGSFD
jgi:hypothetical protein